MAFPGVSNQEAVHGCAEAKQENTRSPEQITSVLAATGVVSTTSNDALHDLLKLSKSDHSRPSAMDHTGNA